MSWDILPKGNLQYFLTKLKGELDLKVDAVTGKGLSTNDYTNEDKDLVATIPDKADSDDISGSKEVTGNPITLTDSSETYAEELSVDLEPIQDLHGYDKPWVGGAGKNKLPLTVANIKAMNTVGSWSDNTYTINGGTITIITDNDGNVTGLSANGSFTSSVSFYLATGVYALTLDNSSYVISTKTALPTGTYISIRGNAVVDLNPSETSKTFTASGTCYVNAYIPSGISLNNYIFTPMICLASAENPTVFAPYSNISPIQGYDIVSVDRCGKNLFNSADIATNTVPDTTNNGRLKTQSGTDTTEHFIPLKPSTTYTISGNSRIRFWLYGANGDYLDTYLQDAGQFTTNAQTYFIRISGNSGWQSNSIQIEENTSATTYEPYNGQTVSLQLGNKNLLPMTVEGIKADNTSGTWSGNVYSINNGTVTVLTDENGLVTGLKANGTFNANTVFSIARVTTSNMKGQSYILSGITASVAKTALRLSDNTRYSWDASVSGTSITIPSDVASESLMFLFCESGAALSNQIFCPMLRDANVTDSTFSPYNPTLGGMVYGGKLNVQTGELVVTHGFDVFDGSDDENWYKHTSSSAGAYAMMYSVSEMIKTGQYVLKTNYLQCLSHSDTWGDFDSFIVKAISGETKSFLTGIKSITTVADWKTYLASNPLQVCYELATPLTYHLTPEQIKLLKGYNYITTNGTTIHLTYQPDNAVGDAVSKAEKYTDRLCKTGVVDTFNLYNGNTKVGSVSLLSNGFKLLYINSTDDGTSFSMYIPDKYVPKSPYQSAVVCLEDGYVNPRIIEIYQNRIIVTEDKFEQGATYGTGLYY